MFVLFSEEETLMCNELIDLSNESSGSCDDINITIKPKKISIDPEYSTKLENPQPADLVLAILDDIKHPAKDDHYFGLMFLILGAIM